MNALPADEVFDSLKFDNQFTTQLPADSRSDAGRRQVEGACFSRVLPKGMASPSLLSYSPEVARLIGLGALASNPAAVGGADGLAQVFSGNHVLDGMDPHACCYGGHQFGNWAGQLGDGRAINLGEVVNPDGERWMLQLKGAGPTPYSRTADGLAVVRSSVREFLCSEAMYHLGVPTTRALSLVGTGEDVVRDMFYDGNVRPEPGAVVCRVAPSFTRFGSFEIFAARGDHEVLRQLADHTIRTDFHHLGEPSRDTYLAWFTEVCERTADMVVHWMRVGFVHGVMNTDNMSILGLTIDYGPYGWLEGFDPDWTPNTTDAGGRRYRYGHQPQIAMWNLVRLANAIYPLIDEVEPLQAALGAYSSRFEASWNSTMADKLGLTQFDAQAGDAELISELNTVLQLVETDMTIFYRQLTNVAIQGDGELGGAALSVLQEAYYDPTALTDAHRAQTLGWLNRYANRVRATGVTDDQRRVAMNRVNPKYVMRNYIAQLAIDKAETGDGSMVDELLDVMRKPYDEQPGREHYAEKRPEWARNRAGCSMLSCSS
jgi:serine/tyrosine/threonine adenylyltransferase